MAAVFCGNVEKPNYTYVIQSRRGLLQLEERGVSGHVSSNHDALRSRYGRGVPVIEVLTPWTAS
jgi:hypothetical protein